MIGSEFLLTDFVMFFFGVGALATAAITYFVPGVQYNILLQFLLWIGFSGISLLTLRKYFGRTFRGSMYIPEKENQMIGQSARVVEPIEPEKSGRISFEGTTWKAVSYDERFSPGDTVTIIQKEGIGYVVTGALLPDETQ